MELYAEAFDQVNALDNLEAFCSLNGPAFYGLEANSATVTLTRKEQKVPETLEFGSSVIKPLRSGETIAWTVEM